MAGIDRRPDQPYARNVTTRRVSPSAKPAVTVKRAQTESPSMPVHTPAGPSTTWSIAAPTRRPLRRVLCTRIASASWAPCISGCSGASSTAAARGSSKIVGSCSLATSSDWTTTCNGRLIGRTSYRIAAAALGERHQPGRAHLDVVARGRGPDRITPQHAVAQRQDPFVRAKLAGAHIERLVLDQQPDQLAVGDVDDRLTNRRKTVAGLRIGQRAVFVHRVEVGARQPVRLALVEVATQPDVPVGQREHRLGLGRTSRSMLVSRIAQGSTANAGCVIMT